MKNRIDIKMTNPPILAEEPGGSCRGAGTFTFIVADKLFTGQYD